MAKERSKIVFFKRKQQHKTRSYPIKQGGDSHKDPLQYLDPNNEELYPKTLEMVDYLNQKTRSYIINLIVKWDNNQSYEAEIIAEKESGFPIIKEEK